MKAYNRCEWCGTDPLYRAYHDNEWGKPSYDDRHLFAMLCLEGMQAGLSWITILKKRERYYQVFADFDPAIIVAAAGVGLQFWLAGSVSWATAWVCLTYPIYYGLRRWQGVPALMGLFVDLSVIAPIALGFLLWQNSSISIVTGSMTMGLLVIGLGMISALAMQTNLKASQVLPMNTFGMLSYLEPALMFLLSIFVLHEAVNGTMIASFALIWVGVLLMIVNTIRASKKSHSTAICD